MNLLVKQREIYVSHDGGNTYSYVFVKQPHPLPEGMYRSEEELKEAIEKHPILSVEWVEEWMKNANPFDD
jgi:hypothetical protein